MGRPFERSLGEGKGRTGTGDPCYQQRSEGTEEQETVGHRGKEIADPMPPGGELTIDGGASKISHSRARL